MTSTMPLLPWACAQTGRHSPTFEIHHMPAACGSLPSDTRLRPAACSRGSTPHAGSLLLPASHYLLADHLPVPSHRYAASMGLMPTSMPARRVPACHVSLTDTSLNDGVCRGGQILLFSFPSDATACYAGMRPTSMPARPTQSMQRPRRRARPGSRPRGRHRSTKGAGQSTGTRPRWAVDWLPQQLGWDIIGPFPWVWP